VNARSSLGPTRTRPSACASCRSPTQRPSRTACTSTSPAALGTATRRLRGFSRSGRAGVDIGQTGAESWTVLADPEGNELTECPYSPTRGRSGRHRRFLSAKPLRALIMTEEGRDSPSSCAGLFGELRGCFARLLQHSCTGRHSHRVAGPKAGCDLVDSDHSYCAWWIAASLIANSRAHRELADPSTPTTIPAWHALLAGPPPVGSRSCRCQPHQDLGVLPESFGACRAAMTSTVWRAIAG
jgi:hypothetical protein